MKHKTRKIMEYSDEGRHYLVIRHFEAVNPYALYRITYDGKRHRKKIAEYGDMQSILWHILQDGYGVRC